MKASRSSSPQNPVTAQRDFLRFSQLIGLLIAAAVIAGAYWFYLHKVARPPDPPGVQSIVPPEPVADFNLTDQQGKAFTQARLHGKWTIMFFGYTHCPDFCPTTLAGLNSAYHRLEQQAPKLAASTQVVFVSVDPFRDTPPLLKDFVTHFNKDFIGATGSPPQLHRLTDPLGASYDYSDPSNHAIFPDSTRPELEEYVVDHSSGLYIFDDKARAAAWVLPPHTAKRIVSVYEHIRRTYD